MILFFKTPSQHVIATEVDHQLDQQEINELCWLYGDAQLLDAAALEGHFVGPRREMITPWSTNAVEITQNMGLRGITRIEEYVPVEVEEEEVQEQEIFQIVEEMPSFPGGEAKLMEYVAKNIKYPQIARETGIQGRVFVGFVVEPDGSISNVKLLRGIGGGCDEEAMRVIKSLPKWKPGKQRGKAVRVSYQIPVFFKLQ